MPLDSESPGFLSLMSLSVVVDRKGSSVVVLVVDGLVIGNALLGISVDDLRKGVVRCKGITLSVL